jgi:hypothetical protein
LSFFSLPTADLWNGDCHIVSKEAPMHIHGSQMNLNAINPYSAAAEKAAAAQRAADVRKKLLKSASGLEGADCPDETLILGHWLDSGQGMASRQGMDSRQNHAQGNLDYRTAAAGKNSDFE